MNSIGKGTERPSSSHTPNSLSRSGGATFFLLSCRRFDVDWRVPLFQALTAQGNFYHVRLGRTSILTDGRTGVVEVYGIPDFLRLVGDIAARTAPGSIAIYFVSMATALPSMIIALRLLLPRGIWVFDVYDDFSLYWGSSLKRIKGRLVNSTFHRLLTATVIAPPNLRSKFPNAYDLEIASGLEPARRDSFECKQIVVTSNLDGRLDYDFIRDLARELPSTEIHLFGRVTNPTRDLPSLQRLLDAAHNVTYCGEFAESDFQSILANYCIALAPFRVNVPYTRSTDPSRFYDYLNSGLEVISTNIPRARDRADFLHIAANPADAARIICATQFNPQLRKAGRWNYVNHTWSCRAQQLLTILADISTKEGLATHGAHFP